MVEELLEFTRIQDGRITLHMSSGPTSAREFEDTVFMYGSRLTARRASSCDYIENDDEIPEIPCDRGAAAAGVSEHS